jgi:hypothetical protein
VKLSEKHWKILEQTGSGAEQEQVDYLALCDLACAGLVKVDVWITPEGSAMLEERIETGDCAICGTPAHLTPAGYCPNHPVDPQ